MSIDRDFKMKVLHNFCENFDSCRDCPLDRLRFSGNHCMSLEWHIMTDSDLNRAYNVAIIRKNPTGKMTADDKRMTLDAFCGNMPLNCEGCPLNNTQQKWKTKAHPMNCPDFKNSPESDLDIALKICGIDNPPRDYWSNICEMQKKQTEKGLKKYGQVLEENTGMTIRERLEYLQEELIDGLMYIEHIKASIDEMLTKEGSTDE